MAATVGEVVRHAREESRMSKEQLAKLVGRSVTWLTQVETGLFEERMTAPVLNRLKSVLHLGEEVFKDVTVPKTPTLPPDTEGGRIVTPPSELAALRPPLPPPPSPPSVLHRGGASVADATTEDWLAAHDERLFKAAWVLARDNAGVGPDEAWARYQSLK